MTHTVLYFSHRMLGARLFVGLAFFLLGVLFFWRTRAAYYNFKFRRLTPLIGHKKPDGSFSLKVRPHLSGLTLEGVDHSYTLSHLREKSELLEKEAHLKIGLISEEIVGFWLWKKPRYILHQEKKLPNYTYDTLKKPLRRGDIILGRDIVTGELQVKNIDQGDFSHNIKGTSGTGKSNLSQVCLLSGVDACNYNKERFNIIVSDPKTSFLWAKKYGAKIYNPLTLQGSLALHEAVSAVYKKILSTAELLNQNGIHVDHIRDLTPAQCDALGLEFERTFIVLEEYERQWSSDRQAKRPAKDDGDDVRQAWDLYQSAQATGLAINNILGIGRAFGVCVIASTQSALLGAVDFPAETNFQVQAASKISPEASHRLFGDRMIATSFNCKGAGEFIVKSDSGIRKIQVPLFTGGAS